MTLPPFAVVCACGRTTRVIIAGVCHACALTAYWGTVPEDDPKPGDTAARTVRRDLREYRSRPDVRERERARQERRKGGA